MGGGRFFYFVGLGKSCIFAAMKIVEAIARYHDYIAHERRLSPRTVGAYDAVLEGLEEWLRVQGVVEMEDLTARDLRAWEMEHMARGEAAATVCQRLSAVGSWLRYLRRQGLYDRDLMAKVSAPRLPKRLPVFFRESETEHLYEAGLFGEDFWGQRDKLMLRMLYETGIRRSELVGLRESSVDVGALTVKVRGKRDKERVIPIEIELAHNISDYIALKKEQQGLGASEWLFVNHRGEQMRPEGVNYVVKKYMTSLSDADRVSPHVFRHSFATHILSEGGDLVAVKELLGHENLATTEVYTHVTREHLKEVYRQAHPRGRRK